MLSFWAIIEEADVENYVKSLILPEYMSHLIMSPFRFAHQSYNTTGNEPLVVTYTGECRLEELTLDPEQHALPLLASLKWHIHPDAVHLDPNSSWSWNVGKPVEMEDSPAQHQMRLFFEPKSPVLNVLTDTPFPPDKVYVSISKGIVFIDSAAIAGYIEKMCRNLCNDHSLPEENNLLECRPIAGGFSFRFGPIAGEFFPVLDPILFDLLKYTGIEKALNYLDNVARIHWENGAITVDSNGITIHILPH